MGGHPRYSMVLRAFRVLAMRTAPPLRLSDTTPRRSILRRILSAAGGSVHDDGVDLTVAGAASGDALEVHGHASYVGAGRVVHDDVVHATSRPRPHPRAEIPWQ
jgi:hypothetical protein